MIPARKVGSKVNTIDPEAVNRIGAVVCGVIKGALQGECALSPLEVGRLSFKTAAEAEWVRLSGMKVYRELRRVSVRG
ncbi:MAG TPA: hypothetical protein VGB17_15640 [Pyrinomonadaceae bacterium]|jgi:hypothetical protein